MEPIHPVDTSQLMEEAIQAAQKWETPLGKARKGKAQEAFEALRQGQIKLDNPEARLQRLRPADFETQGLDLSPGIKQSMQGKEGYAFYLLTIPVLLYPGRGAQYRLLESSFTFDVIRGQRLLAIQNAFPKPVWKPVLDFGGSLTLALDSNLEWGVELDPVQVNIAKVSGELAGRVANQDQLESFIKITPFSYSLGRMEIEATFSSATAAWRLDSKEALRSQANMQFVILLKVPKEVARIKVEAAAQAEPSFNWLIAQVEHVFERLPDAVKQILQRGQGMPMQDFQTWTLDLPQ